MNNQWEKEAKWVWTPEWGPEDESGSGKFVYFRKVFELGAGGVTCTARVSADSRYRLYVNGQRACFGPCKGDHNTWYYETVDLTPYLVVGTNVISVQVLRYPALGRGNDSVWRTKLPGLLVHGVVCEERTGSEIVNFHTDETWFCKKDEAIALSQGVYTQFLGITEYVDGSKRPQGWLETDDDTASWGNCIAYTFYADTGALKPWVLESRPIPALYETPRRFKQVVKTSNGNGGEVWTRFLNNEDNADNVVIPAHTTISVDLDAGELTTGFLELSMNGGGGGAVRLLAAECYERKPFSIPWRRDKGDRTDSVNGDLYGDIDTYLPAGTRNASLRAADEVYEPFWFRTFRYIRLEIETADEPLTLNSFTYRETGYPLEVGAAYRSSQPEESLLWDISVRTLRRCMHETYEDCPYYEQLQYGMDTRSQILFTYLLSGDDRLARRTVYDFHSSILPNGLTQSRYPSVAPQVIPGFSLYWVLMLHDHMMFYGDREWIERYLNGVDGVLGYFHRMLDSTGLVGAMDPRHWSFVDWAIRWKANYGMPDAAKSGPLTVYNLMYAYALQHAAELAVFAGRTELAEVYKTRAKGIIHAVKTHCISATRPGLFTDGPGVEEFSQHAQAWAVLCGAVHGDEARRIMGISISDPAFVPCSFAMSFYLFRALSLAGLYDRVDALFEPWRKMARDNVTTWMEDLVSQRSDAHAWGSVPIYEYAVEALGVLPIAPGFRALRIRPAIGQRSEASGRVITPEGPVDVNWRINGGKFRLRASWPEALRAVIELPSGERIEFERGGVCETECQIRLG